MQDEVKTETDDKTENPLNMLSVGTMDDMKTLKLVAAGCGMKVAAAVFMVDAVPRLKQFTLVHWQEDPSNPREILLNNSMDSF